jgi:hypothetical protein
VAGGHAPDDRREFSGNHLHVLLLLKSLRSKIYGNQHCLFVARIDFRGRPLDGPLAWLDATLE